MVCMVPGTTEVPHPNLTSSGERLLVQRVPGWEALKSTCMWASHPAVQLQDVEQYRTQGENSIPLPAITIILFFNSHARVFFH